MRESVQPLGPNVAAPADYSKRDAGGEAQRQPRSQTIVSPQSGPDPRADEKLRFTKSECQYAAGGKTGVRPPKTPRSPQNGEGPNVG